MPVLSPSAILVDTGPIESQALSDLELSPDSLFDEPRESSSTTPSPPRLRTGATAGPGTLRNYNDFTCNIIARRSAPPIPGLFFDPSLLLPPDLTDSVLRACMTSFFPPISGGSLGQVNQVMLFGRAGREDTGFPPFLGALLEATAALLRRAAALPEETHELLFPVVAGPDEAGRSHARQAIVNLYRPGEGIVPHVDLLSRFGDGIIGVSLGGGVAMRFARVGSEREGEGSGEYEMWLPPRSVIVLTGEARYGWTHGIIPRDRDRVEEEGSGGGDCENGWRYHYREPRVSVTFRWLLPGAEVVGGGGGGSDSESDGENRLGLLNANGGNEKGSD